MHSSMAELHAYADEGLTTSQRARLAEHLRSCQACRMQLQEVQQQREIVAQRLEHAAPSPKALPSSQVQLQKLHARRLGLQPASPSTASTPAPQRPAMGWHRWSVWLAPLATAGFLLMWWSQPLTPEGVLSPSQHPAVQQPLAGRQQPRPAARAFPGLRAKGSDAMSLQLLYAAPTSSLTPSKRPVQAVQSGALLQPGGLIQFRVQLGKPRHAMILSVNKQGEVFAYAPFRGKQSIPLPAGKSTRPLGSSLELDDVLGPERFILLTSPKPFTYQAASQALGRWWRQHKDARRPLRLSAPWVYRSLMLYKHKRPTLAPKGAARHRAP